MSTPDTKGNSSSTQVTVRPKASSQLATLLGMDPAHMLDTIKAQCFKCDPSRVSDEQLAAFVSIANDMGVNPLLPGMLYAYPSGSAITPMMGPDGVFKKLAENPNVESWETEVFPADVTVAPTHATCKIYRKNSDRPLVYTALLSEWKVANNPNWNTRPRHMLTVRALKQCARQVIHGIPFDEDERAIADMVNVTHTANDEQVMKRPTPPKREAKGVAAVVENNDKKKEEPVTEVEATPVPEKEKPVEKTTTPATRTAILNKEVATFVVTVGSVKAIQAKTPAPNSQIMPTIQAKVSGEFEGTVIHFGGAKEVDDELVPDTLWTEGSVISMTVKGREQRDGKVLPLVESISAVEENLEIE